MFEKFYNRNFGCGESGVGDSTAEYSVAIHQNNLETFKNTEAKDSPEVVAWAWVTLKSPADTAEKAWPLKS